MATNQLKKIFFAAFPAAFKTNSESPFSYYYWNMTWDLILSFCMYCPPTSIVRIRSNFLATNSEIRPFSCAQCIRFARYWPFLFICLEIPVITSPLLQTWFLLSSAFRSYYFLITAQLQKFLVCKGNYSFMPEVLRENLFRSNESHAWYFRCIFWNVLESLYWKCMAVL